MENSSTSAENQTCSKDQLWTDLYTTPFLTPTSPWVYTALAVLHILLIVIPAVLCNSLAITFLCKIKSNMNSSIPVFYWICTVSIVAPCTFGLLMDLSLLTDEPFMGNCLIQWQGAIYWYAHSFFNSLLFWLLGSLSVLLYWNIQHKKSTKLWRLNLALLGIVLFMGVITFLFIVPIELYNTESCRVRGSFCLIFYSTPVAVFLIGFTRIVVGFAIPAKVVVVTVILTFIKIKKNTVIKDKTLVQSIARLIIVMLAGAFLVSSPTLFLYFGSFHGFHQGLIELLSTMILQLNYVLYPILIMILHKQTRKSIISKFRRLWKRDNRRITPETTSEDKSSSIKTEP